MPKDTQGRDCVQCDKPTTTITTKITTITNRQPMKNGQNWSDVFSFADSIYETRCCVLQHLEFPQMGLRILPRSRHLSLISPEPDGTLSAPQSRYDRAIVEIYGLFRATLRS